MNIVDIASVLPHRYPLVLVDRIVAVEPMKRAKGRKNISMNEPWASGHFPNEPIYPGVLMMETMAQVGGFIFYNADQPDLPLRLYLCAVKEMKFQRKVLPGDVMDVEAELKETFANFYTIQCSAHVDGRLVAKGNIVLASADKHI